jgi:deoxyribodipyrimidine photo-lyase
MAVPDLRLRALVDRPIAGGDHVLYWMTATRRTTWSHALDRAVAHAAALHKPLVVIEPLRAGYRWASDRFHAFVAQGMADNARAFSQAGVAYHPYLEPEPGAGRGLLVEAARRACVVVGDDWPCFFHPRMQAAAARALDALGVRFEVVDDAGIVPVRAAGDQVFLTAHAHRRFLHKVLPTHLLQRPSTTPLAATASLPRGEVPDAVRRRFPAAADLSGAATSLAALPINHAIGPSHLRGGSVAARARLDAFVATKLARYRDDRSGPDLDGQSGLSPWLHWGHIAAAEVADAVLQASDFTPERLNPQAAGNREGFWGLSASAEGFLDELITWRELGFNMTSRRADYDQWSSLPTWAQESLLAHRVDPRDHTYTLDELAQSKTHDPLWNAAQRQLVEEGVMQNYLRMLWGKKVLEWTPDPRDALAHLVELNNRYALDGRDPNSYSGIFWVFGRYDRPWGPKRPIFGVIRYMTSDNTMKKHPCKQYLRRYGTEAARQTSWLA